MSEQFQKNPERSRAENMNIKFPKEYSSTNWTEEIVSITIKNIRELENYFKNNIL